MQDYKEIVNTAHILASQLKEMLTDIMDKLPAEKRTEIEKEMKKLEKAGKSLNSKIKNFK